MIFDQEQLAKASGYTRPSDIRRWLRKPKNRAIFKECAPGKEGQVSAILREPSSRPRKAPNFADLD